MHWSGSSHGFDALRLGLVLVTVYSVSTWSWFVWFWLQHQWWLVEHKAHLNSSYESVVFQSLVLAVPPELTSMSFAFYIILWFKFPPTKSPSVGERGPWLEPWRWLNTVFPINWKRPWTTWATGQFSTSTHSHTHRLSSHRQHWKHLLCRFLEYSQSVPCFHYTVKKGIPIYSDNKILYEPK